MGEGFKVGAAGPAAWGGASLGEADDARIAEEQAHRRLIDRYGSVEAAMRALAPVVGSATMRLSRRNAVIS